jgi:hypothetical protein
MLPWSNTFNFPEKTFPEKKLSLAVVFSGRPKQKKRKNWDNFLGANLQVCHPKGPFLNLGRPCVVFPAHN